MNFELSFLLQLRIHGGSIERCFYHLGFDVYGKVSWFAFPSQLYFNEFVKTENSKSFMTAGKRLENLQERMRILSYKQKWRILLAVVSKRDKMIKSTRILELSNHAKIFYR